MATLKEIRRQFSKFKRVELRSESPIPESDDLKDLCVFTCPSGLVVRVKPMTIKDEYYLEKMMRKSKKSAVRSITQWLQSRTEIIDFSSYGRYGNGLENWMDLSHVDFEAICIATKEVTHEHQ